MRLAAQAGLSPGEYSRTRVRHILLWVQASHRDKVSDWKRTLAEVNIQLEPKDRISLSDLQEHGQAEAGGQALRDDAVMGRHMEWISKYATDLRRNGN
jgi:hypothetical protein